MKSPMVYEPLTKLQCCPTSDGAGAAILCSEEFVYKYGLQNRAIEIAGMSMATDLPSSFNESSCIKMVGFDMSQKAAQEVYRQAGLTAKDVQVVELHGTGHTQGDTHATRTYRSRVHAPDAIAAADVYCSYVWFYSCRVSDTQSSSSLHFINHTIRTRHLSHLTPSVLLVRVVSLSQLLLCERADHVRGPGSLSDRWRRQVHRQRLVLAGRRRRRQHIRRQVRREPERRTH
jgi:hypothetical protein